MSVLRDGFLVSVRDSSLTLLCSPVVTTLRVCLPRAPALPQVLEAVLAEGALESPSILVLAFHSSLSFVEGSSDGLAASVRALLDGCVSLTPFVLSQPLMSELTLRVGFSCSSGPDGGLPSDPVAPFLEETIEVPMWVGSFSSLSGLSTVDCFPVFPRAFSPGVVMAPSHGFRLRWSGRLVLLAPRSLVPPSLSTPFARFVTFWRLCDASWGPPLFPHPLRHFLAKA